MKLSFSALLKGKMFSINKKGRNYQIVVPIVNDLRNQVKELVQDYCFSEVRRRLRISKCTKCTFQDSILLETMVQARGSSSL